MRQGWVMCKKKWGLPRSPLLPEVPLLRANHVVRNKILWREIFVNNILIYFAILFGTNLAPKDWVIHRTICAKLRCLTASPSIGHIVENHHSLRSKRRGMASQAGNCLTGGVFRGERSQLWAIQAGRDSCPSGFAWQVKSRVWPGLQQRSGRVRY